MTPSEVFELILILMAAIVVLAAVADRWRWPPAVAFTLGGIVLAFLPGAPAPELDPQLVMDLFLPPLIMSSAYFTVWRDLKAEARPLLLLAIGAVAFTTLLVGIAAHAVMPAMPWAACFALGAIVSPPDAVAAKAILQRLPLPRRTTTILEGESLINDATGLVFYRFAVVAALTGHFDAGEASLAFVWLAVGGIGIGLVVGYASDQLFAWLKDTHRIVVASFLAAYGSYLAAEAVEASGVLASVACGLHIGWRQHKTLSAHARIESRVVWQSVIFLLEALVFILIGLSLRGVIARLGLEGVIGGGNGELALATIAVVILARFAWAFPMVYVPRWLSSNLRARDPIPPIGVPLVVSWAGMRGVVSLAAALALPENFPGRDAILIATFAVILATVLIQGTTLGPLIRALRPYLFDRADHRIDGHLGRYKVAAMIAAAAIKHLEKDVDEEGTLNHPQLIETFRLRKRAMTRSHELGAEMDKVRREHFHAWLGALAVSRRELIALHRADKIHDSVLHTLEEELDLEEIRLRLMLEGGRA